MLRYVFIGALLLTGCRTASSDSEGKSIVAVDTRTLIQETTIDISKGEPISLIVDMITDRPQANAKFLAESLYITLQHPNKSEACTRPLTDVVTRGDQGTIPYMLADMDEEEGFYVYGKDLETMPVNFSELFLTFKKGINKKWSNRCRVTITTTGYWTASGDIGYEVISDDPERDAAVREYSAALDHRLSHFMWHTSRGAWPAMLRSLENLKAINAGQNTAEAPSHKSRSDQALMEKSIEQYKASGWTPPRYFQVGDEETAMTGAGEDFLYMHRKMIGRLTAYLKERNLTMIPAWKNLPKPDDKQFTLGPKGHGPLPDHKSDEYYYTTERIWEKAYKMPVIDNEALNELAKDLLNGRKITKTTEKTPNLNAALVEVEKLLHPTDRYQFKGLKDTSLSEYGHLLEMTLHNDLHTRYAFLGSASRPSNADPLNRAKWDKDWAYTFQSPNYDSLNDTFSSHVHPWFYRIHGWVDDRINDWLKANKFDSIGTKEECTKAKGNCYVWLSDEKYKNPRNPLDPALTGDPVPWEGPMIAEEKNSSDTKKISLHAHKAPAFTPDVVDATKGFRAPYASMNRILINPDLKR